MADDNFEYSNDMFNVFVNGEGRYSVQNKDTGVVEFETSVLVQACLTADQLEEDTARFFRDKKNEAAVALVTK